MSTSITISKQIAIKDEGVIKTSDVNSIDFTGAGVTATNVGNAVTVNVPGGGGGGAGGVYVLTTPISNRVYNARTSSTSSYSSASLAANTILLNPFIPAKSLTIKNLALNISASVAGGLIRAVIYSDLNGEPSSKLLESTDLIASTTGNKTYTVISSAISINLTAL
jgi:hypothetical protein